MSLTSLDSSSSHNVLIIGGGPAGYTAAIYAARANQRPIQFLGLQPGGQLMITTDVENYPGFASTIQGPWLMGEMQQQAQHVGTQMISSLIERVDFSSTPFKCWTESGELFLAKTVIIATGAQARWLDVPGEETYRGFGVSACATCDGFFFKGKEITVVGGGNTAVEEALFLTNFAQRVTLIHRRDKLRAEKMLQERALKHPKIQFIWDTVVEEVHGKENPREISHLSLKNIHSGETTLFPTEGLFVAIGHTPLTSLFQGQLDLDSEGYIVCVPGTTQTSIPGVFAAGDVQDKVFRQAVTAAGQGCMAALEAEKYLAHFE